MKRLLASMLVQLALVSLSANADNRTGDANNDGSATIDDAALVQDSLFGGVGSQQISPGALADGDLDLDLKDLLLLAQNARIGLLDLAGPNNMLNLTASGNFSTQSGALPTDMFWSVSSNLFALAERVEGMEIAISLVTPGVESYLASWDTEVGPSGVAGAQLVPVNTSGTNDFVTIRLVLQIFDSDGSSIIETHVSQITALVGPSVCGNLTIEPGEICDDGDAISNGEGACLADCSGVQVCGDGATEGTEGCDDGDTVSNGEGACLADCSEVQICGDGATNGTEGCDDGDSISNGEGACVADCSGVQVCGDGATEGTEGCDDGDTVSNGDGFCLADCSGVQVCGDGATEGTEGCDDGDAVSNGDGFCLADCSGVQVCGDGATEGTEGCDDGDTLSNGDGFCLANCSDIQVCGDGATEGTEECDDANADNGDACLNGCVSAVCGDGFLYIGMEECDDGAANSDTTADACRIDCANPRCGDGTIDSIETCDDGDALNGTPNQCNATCDGITVPVCGNAAVEAGEQCDDGGAVPGDGCDEFCQLGCYDCADADTPQAESVANEESAFDGGFAPGGWGAYVDPSFNGGEAYQGLPAGPPLEGSFVTQGVSGTLYYVWHLGFQSGTPFADWSAEATLDGNPLPLVFDGVGAGQALTWMEMTGGAGVPLDPGSHTYSVSALNFAGAFFDGFIITADPAFDPNALGVPQGVNLDDPALDTFQPFVAASCCGDGVWSCAVGSITPEEFCDDGALNGQPGQCNATCDAMTVSVCGNGVAEAGEPCDDGNADQTDGCLTGCVLAQCGDGFLYVGAEECDDGNLIDGDGCDALCAIEYCGDGVAQAGLGEVCDDGPGEGEGACLDDCSGFQICGDGSTDGTEECDIGGVCDNGAICATDADCATVGSANCALVSGNGCTANCLLETCGDGIVNNDRTIFALSAQGRLVDDGGVWQLKDAFFVNTALFEALMPDPENYGMTLRLDGALDVYDQGATTGQQVDWHINRYSPTGPGETTTCAPSGGGYTLGPNGLTYSGASACTLHHSVLRGASSISVTQVGGDLIVSGTIQHDGFYHWVTNPPTALPPELDTLLVEGTFDAATGLGVLLVGLPGQPEACDDGANGDACDGCTDQCQTTASLCGNGALECVEVCEVGDGLVCNDGCYDGVQPCAADCGGYALACEIGSQQCGNGLTEGCEACDDGNLIDGDGCDALCVVEFCGDGVAQAGLGEVCDDGPGEGEGACLDDCSGFQICGDGYSQGTEECDIGGVCDNGAICVAEADCVSIGSANCALVSGNGCSAGCLTEFCGDGIPNNDLTLYGITALGRLVDDGGVWQLKDAYLTNTDLFSALLPDPEHYGLTLRLDTSAETYDGGATTGQLVDWRVDYYSAVGPIEESTCAPSGDGYTLGPNGLSYTGSQTCKPYYSVLRGTASLTVTPNGGQLEVSGTIQHDGFYHSINNPPLPLGPELDNLEISGSFDAVTGLGVLLVGLPGQPEVCDDGPGEGEGACLDDCSGYQVCGDGSTDGTEECDIGGVCDNGAICATEADCAIVGSANCALVSGNGCSADCVLEYCGDGIINNDRTIFALSAEGQLVDDAGVWQMKDGYFINTAIFEALMPDPENYGITLRLDGSLEVYDQGSTTGQLVDWHINRYSPTGPGEDFTCAPSGGGYTLGPNGLTYSGASVCTLYHSVLRGTSSVSVTPVGGDYVVSGTIQHDGFYHWVTNPPTALPPELDTLLVEGLFDMATGLGVLMIGMQGDPEICDDGVDNGAGSGFCEADCSGVAP